MLTSALTVGLGCAPADPRLEDSDQSVEALAADTGHCELPAGNRLLSVEFRGGSDRPRLHVQSLHQADAAIRLTATAFSDGGQTLIELGEHGLSAGAQVVIPLDMEKLLLPARAAVRGGRVTFTADASFADGKRDGNDTGAVYYALDSLGRPALSSRPNVGPQHLRGAFRERFADAPEESLDVALEAGAAGADGVTVQGAPIGPLAVVTKKLCFKQTVTFLDSAGGEDTWANTTPYEVASTGARVNIGTTGSFFLGATIGTNHGCVTGTWTVGSQLVTLFSEGSIAGHSVDVVNQSGVVGSRSVTVNITSSTSTQTFTIDTLGATYEDELNIYLATARALQQVPGLASGALLVRHQGTSSSYSSGVVTIASGTGEGPGDTGDAKEKFTIAHEIGHFVVDDSTDGPGMNYSYTGADTDCTSTSTSHRIQSIEWQNAAFNEGFASFVAARAFNAQSQSDCWINIQEGTC